MPQLLTMNMEERKARIMVVDDEFDLCEILKFNLETDGYQVATTHSAEEALEKDLSHIDLLLLDVMMGGMDGFAMARKLKENPATANIPIIFLTAKTTENDKVNGLNIGADDYIRPHSRRKHHPYAQKDKRLCTPYCYPPGLRILL